MPKTKSIYRRLPGRGATPTSYARLYLGPDHLLQVASNGYSETYKRFYFRDIQAIIFRKTKWGLFWSCVLGGLALPGAIVAIWFISPLGPTSDPNRVMLSIAWLGVATLFGLPLLVNIFAGPTCVCHVQTAVQTEKIPSLNRLKRARKILTQLKPLIGTVQGTLAPPPAT